MGANQCAILALILIFFPGVLIVVLMKSKLILKFITPKKQAAHWTIVDIYNFINKLRAEEQHNYQEFINHGRL